VKTKHLLCVLCLLGLSACATTQSGSQSFDSSKDGQKGKEYTAWDYIESAAMQLGYAMAAGGGTIDL
jgi:hypothetical protein